VNCKKFDSLILIDNAQINHLLRLWGFSLSQKWSRIYRAREASQFHAKCDNKPNTLNNVFGGYTEQSWSGKVLIKLSKTRLFLV